ncbi:MAG: hypothetical protein ABR562_07810, partial [Thermoplasmatota archaeon]
RLPALRRGLPQSYLDLELASPGAGALTWAGYQLRPLLGPLTQRAKPLPPRDLRSRYVRGEEAVRGEGVDGEARANSAGCKHYAATPVSATRASRSAA